MFPPIEEAVLQNNPDFASLYNTLTTVILNPNGSTRDDAGAKEREAVRQVGTTTHSQTPVPVPWRQRQAD